MSWAGFGVALAVLALLLLSQVRRVAVPDQRGHPGAGILLAVCLSLVVFSTTYLALSGQEGQFHGIDTRVDALYFTMVTASTVGYGDITATGQTARVVVMVQMVFNVLFLTAAATAFGQQVRGRAAARTHRATGAPPSGEGTADQA
ncbi:potassium channel family protein [Kitasatospora herbaricolor]|uniref:potassium channel family protein n=1 Tax=Kitasatospora herbaricolor TaxID=68217 RepID=UPI0036DE500B